MSRDASSGAETLVVELPPGLRRRVDAEDLTLELFVLRGSVSLDDVSVGAAGYVGLPQLCGGGELRSAQGALALAFATPNAPNFPPPYAANRAFRAWEQDWTPSLPQSHSVMHRSLRLPDPTGCGFDGGPSGFLRLQYIAPGIHADESHLHHECFEEAILLQGDVLLAEQGQLALGSVTAHPRDWWHGPFITRSGAVLLVNTDAPMGFPWPPRDYPFAEELARSYLDSAPWDVQPDHIPWSAIDWLACITEQPAYGQWRADVGARPYGTSGAPELSHEDDSEALPPQYRYAP
jgi:hypothetical protein